MENMDKGLSVPKWMLINWLEILQMFLKFLAPFVCPSPKFFKKKKGKKNSSWGFVVTP